MPKLPTTPPQTNRDDGREPHTPLRRRKSRHLRPPWVQNARRGVRRTHNSRFKYLQQGTSPTSKGNDPADILKRVHLRIGRSSWPGSAALHRSVRAQVPDDTIRLLAHCAQGAGESPHGSPAEDDSRRDLRSLPAARRGSNRPRGPSAMPTATARFRATTGDGII